MVNVIPDAEADYSSYVDKEFGPVIEEFIDWLGDKTGYKLDERSVFLAIRLYGPFQRSESHQDNLARKVRGDSSPPRPARAAPKGGAKAKTTGPRGKPATAKAAPAPKPAAKATPPKAAAAKARPAGKRGAPAPY